MCGSCASAVSVHSVNEIHFSGNLIASDVHLRIYSGGRVRVRVSVRVRVRVSASVSVRMTARGGV